MKHQRISNLLNETSDSRLDTRIWNIIYQTNRKYGVGN